MRFATLVFAGCVLLCASLAAQVKSKSDLLDRLSSPSLAERREAVRSLDAEKIGNLEPELAVKAILMAAQDTDPSVREWALGGLGILAAAARTANTNPSAAAFVQAIHASAELRPLLERIITEDPSAEVVLAASAPFMALYGSDPVTEAMLLDRVDREPDPVERIKLLDSVDIGGIDSEQTIERLARYLDEAPPMVQRMAAHLLLSLETLPADRFEDFLRIVETPQTFADPELLRALPRFGVSPERYLPRLVVLQTRLEQELQKPREQRTLVIYNDAYYKRTLDEAIATARKKIEAAHR